MPEFMPEPKIHLKTKNDLIEFVKNTPELGFDKWCIKSDFIIECICKIEDGGKFAYDDTVKNFVIAETGIQSEFLSTLVYNAQRYKGSDDLYNAGYVPLWENTLEKAYELGYKLETESGKVCRVEKIGRSLYAIPRRCHKKCLVVMGQPVKFVN